MSKPSEEELSARFKVAAESIRSGENNGALPDNVNMGVTGVMNVYENPEGREPGTLNAKWGDKPIERPLNHVGDYGEGVMEMAHDTRHGVLDRVFSGTSEARRAARAEIAANFVHGANGEYEARTALLSKEKTASANVFDEGSLSDRIRSLVGR